MLTKEQNIKTAFILSVIASSVLDLLLLSCIFYYRIGYIFTSNAFAAFFILPTLAAPFVLGCIALTYLRDAGDVTGKYRAFYVFARVLSIISIVEGAIFATIGFIAGAVLFVNSMNSYTLL